MAHFKAELGDEADAFAFVTFTLRPADVRRMTGPEQTHALRYLLAQRLVRRAKLKTRHGKRPRYVGQVDLNDERRHHHLHALIETDLSLGELQGEWIDCGGGIDADAVMVRPTADDLARVSGYIVEGCRWNQGYLLCSRGIGYNTKRAKAERRRHAVQKGGRSASQETFELVEYEKPERAAVARPQFEPFESVASVPESHRSKVRLRGGEYAIRRHYDAASKTLLYTAEEVDRSGRRPKYRTLGRPPSKPRGVWYLRRYDARRCKRSGEVSR